MLDVVAAVNDEAILARNLMRSPLLADPEVTLRVQKGHASAALAYRAAMRDGGSEILVFAHQDAYLPRPWKNRLMRNIARLEATDPSWAVLGIYGVEPTGAQVGWVWSSGLDAMFGRPFHQPAAVESIDEVLIVLRRASGVEFDAALPGFHLYATDLVQTALARGLGAYVICAPVVHNSRPSLYLGRDYFDAYRYVSSKWRHRLPIRNHVAQVVGPGLAYVRLRARHQLNEWRYSKVNRQVLDRNYDCVHLARQQGLE